MNRVKKTYQIGGKVKTALVAFALCLTLCFSSSFAFAETDTSAVDDLSDLNASALPSPTVLDTVVPSKTNIPDALAYGATNTIDLDKVELLEGGDFWQLKKYDDPRLALTTKDAQKGEHNYSAPTAKIKIPNFVTDNNGQDLDLVLTIDFPVFYVNYSSSGVNTSYYPCVFSISRHHMWCIAENTLDGQSSYTCAQGIFSQERMNVDAHILYAGTDTQYTSQYPAAWSYSDIDVATWWIDSSHNAHNSDRPSPTDNSSYNEAVYLGEGTQKTYVSKKFNLSTDSTNRLFISKANENGNTSGEASYDVAGLVALTDAGHYRFSWRGSDCGTLVLETANYHTGIKLSKSSSESAFTQSCEGAVYGVYSDSSCKTLVKEITLDKDGQGRSSDTLDLDKTTYYVKEITAPAGYKADTNVYTCDLSSSAGKWYELDLKDDPLTYQITTEVVNGSIDEGETVYWGADKTINYSPNEGYHLEKVTVDGKEVSKTDFAEKYTFENIQADHNIKVVYAINTYQITTEVENGTIDPNCTVDWGTNKTINYSVNEGYHLAKVEVDGKEVDKETYASSYAFENVREDHSIKVTYEINTYTITTYALNGTIDQSCTVNWSDSKTINYKANEGYHLEVIRVDGKSIDLTKYPESYTFENVRENHDIKVTFAVDKFKVTTEVENGTIDTQDSSCVNHDGTYNWHKSPTITYKPNEGYHLDKVLVDGKEVSKTDFAEKYTFENIQADHKIKVVYTINTYQITTEVVNGTIDPNCTVDWGTDKSLGYKAQEGYHLAKVEVDGKEVSTKDHTDSYSFTNVRENHSIKVTYAINTYGIETAVENGTIDQGCTINWNDSKTISYKANEGYHLAKVVVDGQEVDIAKYPNSYAFNNVKENHSIKVTYEINQYQITTEVVNGTIDQSCTVDWGTNKTINYSANEGYHLAKVEVDGKEVSKEEFATSYAFNNVHEDHSIKVEYAINEYQITTEVVNGTIDESCSAEWGENKTIAYKANEGYHLAKVEVDNAEVDITKFADSYEFENIQADHSIKVTYEIDTFVLAMSVEHGTIDTMDKTCVNEDGTYNWHTSPTITYKPDQGYELDKVAVDNKEVDKEQFMEGYTFDNIESDHKIDVVYTNIPVEPTTEQTQTITTTESVLTGDNLILLAIIGAIVAVVASIVGYVAWKKRKSIDMDE